MRKVLIIGIDFYGNNAPPLYGCVNDAHKVDSILSTNGDGTVNFNTKILTGTGSNATVSRQCLWEATRELFFGDEQIALFYFSGHGHIDETGGYLVTSDTVSGNDGMSFSAVLSFANQSTIRNKIIIIDSCHAGAAGMINSNQGASELADGITILAASTAGQHAVEENEGGIFTTLLVDALNGAARNLVGRYYAW